MLADFVRCTHNGTGGASTLTLAAISGWPQPTDVAGTSGTRRVMYEINEYSDSSKSVMVQAERGRGLLNLATNVLTRDEIGVTWNGTTYNGTSATALTFGNTAANIDILLTASSVTQRPALPVLYAASGADTQYAPLNDRMTLDSSAGGTTLTAGRRYYQPIEHAYAKPITTVAVNANAVTTTGNVRVSLYEWGLDGGPGMLIRELTSSAQCVIATAAGIKSANLSTPLLLPPGRYWAMVQADAAVSLVQGTPYGNQGAGFNGARDIVYAYKDATYGTAPSSGDTGITAVSRSAGGQIMVYIK